VLELVIELNKELLRMISELVQLEIEELRIKKARLEKKADLLYKEGNYEQLEIVEKRIKAIRNEIIELKRPY